MDNFVPVKALSFTNFNHLSQPGHQRLSQNQLGSTSFDGLQQGMDSGSGPGCRSFESTRPDHYFPSRFMTSRCALLRKGELLRNGASLL
jgi:hypothetical protein